MSTSITPKKNKAPGLDPIEILINGRRSKAKPFSAAQKKAALQRIVQRVPEVMVKVSGGGKTVKHVLAHLEYITRKGKLEASTDEHDKVSSRDELKELMDEWGLDFAKGVGKHKLVFNIVMSMPAGTNAAKLHQAVQEFARDQFYGDRQYLMVLHEPDTDPSRKKAEHPHVHLVVKAEGYDGNRLYIRKATLETWRAAFAERLREHGIEANATPRDIRGKTRKSKKTALVAIDADKRKSFVRDSKLEQARRDADLGIPEHPWDTSIQRRRTEVIETYQAAAGIVRKDGDENLARQLEAFAQQLPPIQTERQQIAKFLRENVAMQRAERNKAGKAVGKTPERALPDQNRKTPDQDREQ